MTVILTDNFLSLPLAKETDFSMNGLDEVGESI
jgi:hypothetical protein